MFLRKTNFLSFIASFERVKPVLVLGTGGSAKELLEKYENLNDHFCIGTLSYGCYYLAKRNIKPDIWQIKNVDSLKMFLRLELMHGLVSLESVNVFIPSFGSNSKVSELNPYFLLLRLLHPRLNVVVYKEHPKSLETPKKFYFSYPVTYVYGGALENALLPIVFMLGIKELYMAGNDMRDTGHFWDLDFSYQDIKGRKLSFPNDNHLIEFVHWINNSKSLERIYVFNSTEVKSFYDDKFESFN